MARYRRDCESAAGRHRDKRAAFLSHAYLSGTQHGLGPQLLVGFGKKEHMLPGKTIEFTA